MLSISLEKIIDYIIGLKSYKQQANKELFVEFINPTYQLFEEIHSEYMITFTNYINLLKNDETPINEIIEIIKDDISKSHIKRAKLDSMTEIYSNNIISTFCRLLENYLTTPESLEADNNIHINPRSEEVIMAPKNVARSYCINLLNEIESNPTLTRKNVYDLIYLRVKSLQQIFYLVTHEYHYLKKMLYNLK